MNIKEEIIKKLEEVVKELTKDDSAGSPGDIEIYLAIPKDDSHGDYSSNVALRLAKTLGKNPLEIAKQIANRFMIYDLRFTNEKEKNSQSSIVNRQYIDKVDVVAPGFINFYLSKGALLKNAEEVLQSPKEIVGIKKNPKYKKAIVEYSSPNIAKPFTIGHLRSTIIGDAIANLLEAVGYEVYRDNHLGDWGTQFGKQIYAIKTWGNEEALEKSKNPIKDLVALYVKFHEEAEKNPELEEEGRKWFKKLEDGDKEARRLWQKCIDLSFKEFDRIYSELGIPSKPHTAFENNGRGYGEAFFEDKMEPVIKELKAKKLLKEDKAAQLVFFQGDKLPPLMIIKKDGATLYATRDLATDKFRLDHYGKDILVINEVGAEQSLYFRQLHETESLLGWYKKDQRVHVGHGLFRFKEGKMSTRKGNVIWLDDVLSEAKERAFKLSDETKKNGLSKPFNSEHSNNDFESSEIAKQVAMGALKWNDLKRSAHLDIAFDWDEVLSMQGNSGPYVQYTYTRTQSILKKAGSPATSYQLPATEVNEDELRILRLIQKFPEIVEEAAATYSPNLITEYLFILSQIFNNFYQKYRILNASSEEEKQIRLGLTAVVGTVLRQGLSLLGIQAPEKM